MKKKKFTPPLKKKNPGGSLRPGASWVNRDGVSGCVIGDLRQKVTKGTKTSYIAKKV